LKIENRPYVILNAAMTLDGKIATKTRDSEISSPEDWRRVHRLRAKVDGLMVGIGTILTDNPKLRVKHPRKNPLTKIVVDSLARTPVNANIFKYRGNDRIVIAVTSKASKKKLKALKKAGAKIVVSGSGRKVNLKLLLKKLWRMKIKTLMVEGGGNLNWGMVKANLVDEVRVAIAPVIVGGKKAITLVEGEGYTRVREGLKLKLVKVEKAGEDLVLTYKRKG